jgi:hypothetical protein
MDASSKNTYSGKVAEENHEENDCRFIRRDPDSTPFSLRRKQDL